VSNPDQPQSPFSIFTPTVALAGFNPSAPEAQAPAGGQFDGVVRISDGKFYGSGTLLSTGRHILTAAHLVDGMSVSQLQVYFTLISGITTMSVTKIDIHPGWTGGVNTIDNDVAVLELSATASAAAQRYDLYTAGDEIGQTFNIVGYGASTGSATDTTPPVRRTGINTFDSDAALFNQNMGWHASAAKQLVFDYDDGTASHDAFGRYFGINGLGFGAREAMMTPGDSGGPSFLQKNGQWLVAGINSYTARPSGSLSDIDAVANGSFGEFGALMRVSAYSAWIDARTGVDRVLMGQAGTHPDRSAVPKKVTEGGAIWFLVEIGEAQSKEVSVHYATRDGSAKADEDYLPAHGDIIFAAGQTWCKVMIETLADKRAEGDEVFSLVLTKPQGGNFAGQTELVASRTILDDPTTVALVGVAAQGDPGVVA
jgi:hypothetical protein